MSNIIQTRNLSFSYSGKDKILKDISFEVPRGSVYGFLGPNGAGKTTTIRVLLGLLFAGREKVMIFDKFIEKHKIDIYKKIGALIEQPSLYNHLSAKENLEIVCIYRNMNPDRIPEVLDLVKLPVNSRRKVKAFSTGMKQRLGLAMALLPDPELIILDEPTNGLDPEGIREVRDIIIDLNKKKNITIFLSSHLLSEIEKVCSHVAIINHGHLLFQGTIEHLRASKEANYRVLIETNDIEKAYSLLADKYRMQKSPENLYANLRSKEDVSPLIDLLRSENIIVYQIKNEIESLEDIFITLTKSDSHD